MIRKIGLIISLLGCTCTLLIAPLVGFARSADEDIAQYLGIPQTEVQSLMQVERLDAPQITIAAVIAKKSHQPLSQVIQAHKKVHNWEQLSLSYDLQPDDLWEELKEYFPQVFWYPRAFLRQPELLAQVLSIYLVEDEHRLLSIVKKEDFASVMAAILAKISGREIEHILHLKQRMSWDELKQHLHISTHRIGLEQERLKRILYQEMGG